MTGSTLDVKPSDLDLEGRPQATLINLIINSGLIQVYVNTCTSAPLMIMLMSAAHSLPSRSRSLAFRGVT